MQKIILFLKQIIIIFIIYILLLNNKSFIFKIYYILIINIVINFIILLLIIIKNTLFIINGLTFDALTFILLSKNIKLHGGSHTRRHLIQPLELKLAFAVKDLQLYVDYYIQWFLDPDPADSIEYEIIRESKLKSFDWRINYNYYNSDSHKMFLNPEFQNLNLKFKQLLKIAYKSSFSRDVLYTIFLSKYSLELDDVELKMVLNQKGIDLFNKILNDEIIKK